MTDQRDTRSIHLSVEVPGTPEEVWDAVATGPGVTSWFTRDGDRAVGRGRAITDFGSFGKEESSVTVYDPPHRFVGEAIGRDGRTMAVEWLVEARDGGTCIVRLVNSGFGAGADWDNDFDGMTQGWTLFLENLRLHLTHFGGQHAQPVLPMATVPGPNAAAWAQLCKALGVPSDLGLGDRFDASVPGAPPLSGVVQHVQRTDAVSDYILLLDGELRGTALVAAEGKGETIMLSTWLYVYDRDPAPLEQATSAFMAEQFKAAPTSEAEPE